MDLVMNFITLLIDSLVTFVRRNPIFCLVLFILAVGAPSLLAGIASVVLYIILGLLIVTIITSLYLRWRFTKVQRDMKERYGAGGGFTNAGGFTGNNRQRSSREGEVHLHRHSDAGDKRVSDDVGDYVDFVEEKTDKK